MVALLVYGPGLWLVLPGAGADLMSTSSNLSTIAACLAGSAALLMLASDPGAAVLVSVAGVAVGLSALSLSFRAVGK
jgi:hypothetical protein